MKTVTRPACKEDCQGINDLIQNLADFEHMRYGPTITTEGLERDGFGEVPLFQCIVAANDDKLVGFAITYFSYSSWGGKSMYLEDLFVAAEFKNRGVGSALFNAVAKRAFEEKCYRLDFCVLTWSPAAEFYKNKGAVDITETEKWHHYRLNSTALKRIVDALED